MSDFDKSTILPPSEQSQTLIPKTKTIENNTMVYRSEVMRQLMRMIEKVSPSAATVLVMGESGTGKELVAQQIHQKSNRAR